MIKTKQIYLAITVPADFELNPEWNIRFHEKGYGDYFFDLLQPSPQSGDAKDAARYRWLRNVNNHFSYTTDFSAVGDIDLIQINVAVIGDPIFTAEGHFDYANELDRAIDTALSATPSQPASPQVGDVPKPDAPFGYIGLAVGEVERLREIEHRAWHIFDEAMDDDSGYLKIDMEVSGPDLDALHELLPDAHPEYAPSAPQPVGADKVEAINGN